MLNLFGAVILIVIINPYLLTMLGALCIVFAFMRRVYLKTSKNIKRLEGISKLIKRMQ